MKLCFGQPAIFSLKTAWLVYEKNVVLPYSKLYADKQNSPQQSSYDKKSEKKHEYG